MAGRPNVSAMTTRAAKKLITDPSSNAACELSDEIADLLLSICADGLDWRVFLVWAEDARCAVKPEDARADQLAALFARVDADADKGEARMEVVRRGVRQFRAAHVDPEGDVMASPDQHPRVLAEQLGISEQAARNRWDAVTWGGLNPNFWA